jgi:3-deoxy-manno-octulosonate cytidylyltransferase (CMP-KDO synthetase)
MIERVYAQALKAKLIDEAIVATDDERIVEAVVAFGGQVVVTSAHHASGTDRVAEVASKNPHFDIIVNVQGDEPYIHPQAIDAAIEPLILDASVEMATLAHVLVSEQDAINANIVKVVTNNKGNALYFSRAAIPFKRSLTMPTKFLGHAGLYAYRRQCLLRLAALPPADLELMEGLEQLRALSHGIDIRVITTPYRSVEVNVVEDLARLPVEFPL